MDIYFLGFPFVFNTIYEIQRLMQQQQEPPRASANRPSSGRTMFTVSLVRHSTGHERVQYHSLTSQVAVPTVPQDVRFHSSYHHLLLDGFPRPSLAKETFQVYSSSTESHFNHINAAPGCSYPPHTNGYAVSNVGYDFPAVDLHSSNFRGQDLYLDTAGVAGAKLMRMDQYRHDYRHSSFYHQTFEECVPKRNNGSSFDSIRNDKYKQDGLDSSVEKDDKKTAYPIWSTREIVNDNGQVEREDQFGVVKQKDRESPRRYRSSGKRGSATMQIKETYANVLQKEPSRQPGSKCFHSEPKTYLKLRNTVKYSKSKMFTSKNGGSDGKNLIFDSAKVLDHSINTPPHFEKPSVKPKLMDLLPKSNFDDFSKNMNVKSKEIDVKDIDKKVKVFRNQLLRKPAPFKVNRNKPKNVNYTESIKKYSAHHNDLLSQVNLKSESPDQDLCQSNILEDIKSQATLEEAAEDFALSEVCGALIKLEFENPQKAKPRMPCIEQFSSRPTYKMKTFESEAFFFDVNKLLEEGKDEDLPHVIALNPYDSWQLNVDVWRK